MPLLFLVPAVLAGLAALVIPLVVHLRRRERERPMRFPSLMFLQQVSITTARRRRITDLPLLLIRAAIVTLAVLAFARPVVRPRQGAVARGSRRVVVVLDRSMSMSHRAVWPAAQDSARAIVDVLAAGDRVAVVAFDDEASVEQPLTNDFAAARAAITRIAPGSRGTHFGSGIRAARELLLKEADQTGGEIVVVSDLQRSGAAGLAGLTLPPGVTLRAVSASHGGHPDAAIAALHVRRLGGDSGGRSRIAVSADIVSAALAAPRHTRVTMAINGRTAASRDATLPDHGVTTVAFDPVPAPVGSARVVMSIDPDSLSADDSFRVVVPAGLVRRVVLAIPSDVRPDETLYLERALEAGGDPQLTVERRNPSAIDAATLRDAIAIIYYDAPVPGGRAGETLATWVHNGGGVITVIGPRMANRAGSASLPATARGMVDRTGDGGGVLGDVSLDHPVFAAFRGAAGAPLGSARFYRYPRLTSADGAQVIARFDDGLPALVERQDGAGRWLEVALPLDATSGDFPLQPAYLPFVRQLVIYAAGAANAPLSLAAGEGWLVPATARTPVIRAPSGKLLRPDPGRRNDAITLGDRGFYTIYDGRASGDPLAEVAVNSPSTESDLRAIAPAEIVVGVHSDSTTTLASTLASLQDAERRQRLWRTLLVLAVAALVVETVMTSRGWRATATKVAGVAAQGTRS
ncbi:MAG: VWA domain-containing protein [Gemmatimonadales bacterium]